MDTQHKTIAIPLGNTGAGAIAISLGNTCAPAVARAKHLGQSKKTNYKSCPFDLMLSNVAGVIDCLNTDFKSFCLPEHLRIQDLGKENNEDRFIIRHIKYNWIFNHESFNRGEGYLYKREDWENGPNTYINNNFEKLISRYNERIKNFKYYCESDYYVYFLLNFAFHMDPPGDKFSRELIDNLNIAIKNRFPKLQFEVVTSSGLTNADAVQDFTKYFEKNK